MALGPVDPSRERRDDPTPLSVAPVPSPPTWSPRLCLWHWLLARAALLFACALALRDPTGIAGSPFHPTALACAHLLVLGFVTTQIAGAFHVVAPLALRLHARAGWLDWTLLISILLAASGVASHMALGTYSGVAWSGGVLVAALLLRVPSWWMDLAVAPVPLPIRCGTALAWLALVLTACLGMALAIDRGAPFLPGGHQSALFGHAHLGIGGFALLMVVALGQRLLPMFLPAVPPSPVAAWGAVGGTAVGAFGLGLSMPFLPRHGPWFAVVLALGVAVFLGSAVRMVLVRKPRPADLPRPDPVAVLIVTALLCLGLALALGLLLAFGVVAAPGAQLAYGVLALLGCLGSLVLGLGSRLLPLAGWHAAWHDRERQPTAAPTPPRQVGSLKLAWTTAVCWPLGVAVLASAALRGSGSGIAIGTILLAMATLADTGNVLHGWRRRHRAPVGR